MESRVRRFAVALLNAIDNLGCPSGDVGHEGHLSREHRQMAEDMVAVILFFTLPPGLLRSIFTMLLDEGCRALKDLACWRGKQRVSGRDRRLKQLQRCGVRKGKMRNWKARRRSRGRERRTLPFLFFLKLSVVTYSFFISLIWGKAGRGQRGLPRAIGRLSGLRRTANRKRTVHNVAMTQQGRM